ncbi:type II toxin-antitoxin system death-on-curing family toxin [Pseudoxanthomonas sp. UTMC 1351]|uniref:type II toxin-antitoxin system death-on-curing family toxin n=1 Tax=Pseudoxanthomonas sp. UTMC 1351 TaxID=2695853 RepID=UPI0034CD04C4
MREWNWIELDLIHAVHDYQLAEHGGADGVRDASAIESALARPINLLAYETPDAAALAAAYCYGLAKNHGFVDGNKRTAWIAARIFLADNGYEFHFSPADAVRVMEDVSAGKVEEEVLAAWFRAQIKPIG